MARHARIVVPGYAYHVTQRGNYKQDVYFHEDDYVEYLNAIDFYSKKWKLEILAYCLMRNHVHLIVVPDEQKSMALGIGQAHMEYSKYLNGRMGKTGHLWQGRFFSCLLGGRHLMAAVRYVECNPVRAGFVSNAWDWEWSSARYHMGFGAARVKLQDIDRYLDVDDWRAYLTITDDSTSIEAIRSSTRQGRILGEEGFIERMESLTGRQINRRPRGRPKK